MKVAPWNDPNIKWVCEDHPTQEQEHRVFPWFWKRCGGAGMPEPADRLNFKSPLDIFIEIVKNEDRRKASLRHVLEQQDRSVIEEREKEIIEIIKQAGVHQDDDTIWCKVDEVLSLITSKK